MPGGDALNQAQTPRRELNLDAPGVFGAAPLENQLQADTAADQRGSTMRTRLQTLGQLSDGGEVSPGKAADVQQQEILGRHDARSARSLLTEAQEARQLKPELGQSYELWLGNQGAG